MIIYPNQDVPRSLSLEEASRIVIDSGLIPVKIMGMKVSELNVSSSLQQLFEIHQLEYIGECHADLVSKIGFGVKALTELATLIKELIEMHYTEVKVKPLVLSR